MEGEDEVNAILAAAAPKAKPSTLKAYLRRYELDSPDFAGLADSTKYIYKLLLKEHAEGVERRSQRPCRRISCDRTRDWSTALSHRK